MGRFSCSQPSSSKASWPEGYWDDYKSVDKPTTRSARSGIPSVCNCGMSPVTHTSTTDLNPGRVFYGCKNHKDGGHHLFKWWDEALIEEIHGLRSSIEDLKESMVERLAGPNYWKNTVVSVDLKHVLAAVIVIGLISYLLFKN